MTNTPSLRAKKGCKNGFSFETSFFEEKMSRKGEIFDLPEGVKKIFALRGEFLQQAAKIQKIQRIF
jgi:hypothetical protein